MVSGTEILRSVLKDNGYSMTSARSHVFDALSGHEPQTMAELIKRVGSIDRASVYRAIALFEQLGVVNRLNIGWKYKLELSDKFVHHHHHLTCINCGRVIPLREDKEIEKNILSLAAEQNFVPSDHQLEIRGLCRSCQHPNN